MSERQEKKKRYNQKLELILRFEVWAASEPPIWMFLRWKKWLASRPQMKNKGGEENVQNV